MALPLTALAAGQSVPDVIPLPNGFFPEGIAVAEEHTFYTGSLVDGAICSGDLRTGEGAIPASPGITAPMSTSQSRRPGATSWSLTPERRLSTIPWCGALW